jgi:hypothetical protein
LFLLFFFSIDFPFSRLSTFVWFAHFCSFLLIFLKFLSIPSNACTYFSTLFNSAFQFFTSFCRLVCLSFFMHTYMSAVTRLCLYLTVVCT